MMPKPSKAAVKTIESKDQNPVNTSTNKKGGVTINRLTTVGSSTATSKAPPVIKSVRTATNAQAEKAIVIPKALLQYQQQFAESGGNAGKLSTGRVVQVKRVKRKQAAMVNNNNKCIKKPAGNEAVKNDLGRGQAVRQTNHC